MKNTGKINSKRHKLEVSCLDTTKRVGMLGIFIQFVNFGTVNSLLMSNNLAADAV